MNEISVSSNPFTLFFTPARLCCHCLRWTHIGQAEHEGKHRSLTIQPQCHEHGYYDVIEGSVTPEERKLEHASIERFTVWTMGECGIAQVIGPCPVETIPGYDAERHNTPDDVRNGFLPKGWTVLYLRENESQHVHVVYDFVEWGLTLYVGGKWVER